jgi:NAD-reducing hydrogenase large subunit
LAVGPGRGHYRVGPVAQLRVGELSTPLAAEFQRRWQRAAGGAVGARAVMLLHSVEAIGELLAEPGLVAGPPAAAPAPVRPGVGVGWVDGPRGLLVHRYEVSDAGIVTAATILTPTAQNESWLAGLLHRAVSADADSDALEAAVREADPCLPCAAAPPGAMGLVLEEVTFGQTAVGGH